MVGGVEEGYAGVAFGLGLQDHPWAPSLKGGRDHTLERMALKTLFLYM